MKRIPLILLIMGVGFSANAHNLIKRAATAGFTSAIVSDAPASLAPDSQKSVNEAPSADKPFTLTGDFDLTFYWYDFTDLQMSQTWQTSMYESIEEADAPGEYIIKNFMRQWLNPDPADNSFTTADIKASYDPTDQTFTIAGNQFLYSLDAGDDKFDICLIAVTRNAQNKLSPDADLDIVMRWDGHGFALDPASGLEGLLIGAKTADGYGGLGIAYRAALCPWNATMIYLVAPDFETEAMPYTCNMWASTADGVLSLANYADCGYGNAIRFQLDEEAHTATAYDTALQTLTGIDGQEADLIASDISDDGDYLWPDDRLVASVSVKDGATVMFQHRWGAFFMDSLVGIYSNTYTIITFDVFDESAGIDIIAPDCENDLPKEYYNAEGLRVTAPGNGFYIVRQGSKVTKEIRKGN